MAILEPFRRSRIAAYLAHHAFLLILWVLVGGWGVEKPKFNFQGVPCMFRP